MGGNIKECEGDLSLKEKPAKAKMGAHPSRFLDSVVGIRSFYFICDMGSKVG